jgi:hypothetical protein
VRSDTTKQAHRIAAQLLDAWLARGEPSESCGCDGKGCKDCRALEKAMRRLALAHWTKGES